MVSKIFPFKETRRSDTRSDTMSGRCMIILEAFLSLSVIAMAQRDNGEHKQRKTVSFLWICERWWCPLIRVNRRINQGLLLQNVMFACLLYGLKLRRDKGPTNCTVRKETKTLKQGLLFSLRFTHSEQLCSLFLSPFLWLLVIRFR